MRRESDGMAEEHRSGGWRPRGTGDAAQERAKEEHHPEDRKGGRPGEEGAALADHQETEEQELQLVQQLIFNIFQLSALLHTMSIFCG
jgi:hypothetical protein